MFVKNFTGIEFVVVLIRISNKILQIPIFLFAYITFKEYMSYITSHGNFESIFWFENLKSFNIENLNEKADENI